MLANSSAMARTCTGSLPPYTSSALSQSRLKSCDCNMAITKLNVVSVSERIRNRAVFRRPAYPVPAHRTWSHPGFLGCQRAQGGHRRKSEWILRSCQRQIVKDFLIKFTKNPQKRCQKHCMAPDTSFDRLHFSVQQVFAEIRIVWQLVDIWLPAPLDFG